MAAIRLSGDIKNPNAASVVSPYWAEIRKVSEEYGMPSRDHSSMLLYLQTVEANYGGDVYRHNNGHHMRDKRRVSSRMGSQMRWKPENGSKYWDGTIGASHDDFDCLADLEALGLLEDSGTGANPIVRLTAKGHEACGKLIGVRSKHDQLERQKKEMSV